MFWKRRWFVSEEPLCCSSCSETHRLLSLEESQEKKGTRTALSPQESQKRTAASFSVVAWFFEEEPEEPRSSWRTLLQKRTAVFCCSLLSSFKKTGVLCFRRTSRTTKEELLFSVVLSGSSETNHCSETQRLKTVCFSLLKNPKKGSSFLFFYFIKNRSFFFFSVVRCSKLHLARGAIPKERTTKEEPLFSAVSETAPCFFSSQNAKQHSIGVFQSKKGGFIISYRPTSI